MSPRRVGIVGYGNLGKHLVKEVTDRNDLELAFVWNRSQEVLENEIDDRFICRDLENFGEFSPDLIVEVAHPVITKNFGPLFVSHCDYMVGSPTCLAQGIIEDKLHEAAVKNGVYVPAGAFWGGEDIAKMDRRGTLKKLKVTMTKHPSCFKLEPPLKEVNEEVARSSADAVVLYDGPVRQLCSLAPQNVNTMAAAAIAARSLGFDGVTGSIVADPQLTSWHIVEIEVTGPTVHGREFTVRTVRSNPSDMGAVTGSATYGSFLSSLLGAGGKGPGFHLC